MSLVINHGQMSSRLGTVWTGSFTETAGTNPFDVTPATTPVEGNIMFVIVAGIQSRTVSSPGWTQEAIAIANGTCALFWKIATASEPASYSFTLSGTPFSGTWSFFEIGSSDTDFFYTDSADGTSVTTITTGSYTVESPCVVITALALSASATSSVDNSFELLSAGGSGKAALRRYANPIATPETVTWTIGGTRNASAILFMIKGRLIR